jgi:hypothetical protein
MERDKDNANPTILNTSQLPTRQHKKRGAAQKGPDDFLSDFLVRKPHYLASTFSDASWSDGSESDDEFTIEPIDEQEIFGKCHAFGFGFFSFPLFFFFPLQFSRRSAAWVSMP